MFPFDNNAFKIGLQQVEKHTIQISQTNLFFSEGILLFHLLEETKGYNLQRVICLGGRTHWVVCA